MWDVAVAGARPTPAAAARGLALLTVCIALMYLLRVRAVPERCCFVWQLAAPGRSNHLRQAALHIAGCSLDRCSCRTPEMRSNIVCTAASLIWNWRCFIARTYCRCFADWQPTSFKM